MNAEKNLYEYAVVRYSPRVEREEFINIGLVMMCKRRRWLRTAFHIDDARLSALFPDCDIESLRRQLDGFDSVAKGRGGGIADFEVHERFRWLTAVRSACISTSRPHPGLCCDLDSTFENIFTEMVL